MIAIRSIVYAFAFYLGSAVYVIAAAAAAPIMPGMALSVPRAWARYQGWLARVVLGNPLAIRGTLPTGVVLIAMKHESFYESFATLRLFAAPAVVVKAELLDIPLWGRVALAHGVIPVARETGAAALRTMLKAAKTAIAAGRPIVIFPEGTRIPHGECATLRPGIAGLYKALGLPIVPIAVDSGRLWGWKQFWKRPGTITFLVGETIPVGLPRDEVEQRVVEAINALNR